MSTALCGDHHRELETSHRFRPRLADHGQQPMGRDRSSAHKRNTRLYRQRMHSRQPTAGQLAKCLERGAESFAPGELAYLALTSKIERPLQDRLAWSLHTQLPGLVVAREWRNTDIAVLSADGSSPEVLLEAKAMYSFDVASPHSRNAARYPQMMQNDIAKARRLDPQGTADVYALALVTHPHGQPPHLPYVIKYLDSIERAESATGSKRLQGMTVPTLGAALRPLGPVRTGSLAGGAAFGVEVTVRYWLVGPA